ncbi:MAG TPA: hypothetical protein VK789_02620 [Bryobacteraceae bacterium]|nr:hypothetical protein [Bryobacteraceae bacterium]
MFSRLYVPLSAALLIAFVLAATLPMEGQTVKAVAKASKTGTTARTPDGHPDFQGYWTNAGFTPLERPANLAGKEFFTEEEAIAFQKQAIQKENSQAADDIHYDNVIWQGEGYSKGAAALRTSIVFDPPDGKLPPLSAAGQKRALAEKEAARRREAAESAQDRSLAERCITWGNEGPPMLGSTYDANVQFIQTPGAFAVRHEIGHSVRYIPTDGSPHVSPGIRQMGGDSRGRWEGDTLVVDSTNFTDRTNFRGPPSTARQDIFSSRDLHVVERFTLTDADTVVYRFTVEDPSIWTRPWSGEMVMRRIKGPIYEYACHEGNYGLANILAAARKKEAAAH